MSNESINYSSILPLGSTNNLLSMVASSTNLCSGSSSYSLVNQSANDVNMESASDHQSSIHDIASFTKIVGVGAFSKCILLSSGAAAKKLPLIAPVKNTLRSSAKKQRAHMQALFNEYNIHKQLKHPNIVDCIDMVTDKNHMYLIMEYCETGTLRKMLKGYDNSGLPIFKAKRILRDILEGLIYLHCEKQIVHRDLKIANIFIHADGSAKLGDFGLSVDIKHLSILESRNLHNLCGTPNYIAPEMIRGDSYGYPIDIWAFGIIMFIVLCGRAPFEDADVKLTSKRISNLDYKFNDEELKQLPTSAMQLIQQILVDDPLKRPSLLEIRKSLFFSRSLK